MRPRSATAPWPARSCRRRPDPRRAPACRASSPKRRRAPWTRPAGSRPSAARRRPASTDVGSTGDMTANDAQPGRRPAEAGSSAGRRDTPPRRVRAAARAGARCVASSRGGGGGTRSAAAGAGASGAGGRCARRMREPAYASSPAEASAKKMPHWTPTCGGVAPGLSNSRHTSSAPPTGRAPSRRCRRRPACGTCALGCGRTAARARERDKQDGRLHEREGAERETSSDSALHPVRGTRAGTSTRTAPRGERREPPFGRERSPGAPARTSTLATLRAHARAASRRAGAQQDVGIVLGDGADLALEGELPVLARPLADVLELIDERLGAHPLLSEHVLGLGREAPRVRVGLAGLARPDLARSSYSSPVTRMLAANAMIRVRYSTIRSPGDDLQRAIAVALLEADHPKSGRA